MLPQEKLFQNGPKDLHSWELLSVIFGHGSKKEDVFTTSKRIIRDYGFHIPSEYDPSTLQQNLHIQRQQAARLSSVIELGFRWYNQLPVSISFNSCAKVAQYVSEMKTWQKEAFRGLYVNSRYQLIWDEVISMGSLVSSTIHPREVFLPAIKVNSAAIILIHNHPSGTPDPSEEDIETTKTLHACADILHIPILDHIIIAKNGCYSFQEHGLI